MTDLDLSAVLCSRLCHDMVSPIGALANGIEMLAEEDDDAMRAEALKLMEMSASQASKRLQYYRLAFGASGGTSRQVNLQEAHAVTHKYFDDSKTNLTWDSADIETSKLAIKLLLNLILVAHDALARGGDLTVTLEPTKSNLNLEVSASGEGARIREEMRRALDPNFDIGQLEPRYCAAYLAARIADELGAKLKIDDNTPDVTKISVTV